MANVNNTTTPAANPFQASQEAAQLLATQQAAFQTSMSTIDATMKSTQTAFDLQKDSVKAAAETVTKAGSDMVEASGRR